MGLGGCVAGNIKSNNQFQKDLDNKYGVEVYKLVSNYQGSTKILKVKHTCGKISKFTASSIITGIAKCPCQHKKQNFRTLESHNKEVHQWWGKQFDCIEYKGSGSNKQYLNTYQHKTCGGTFQKTLPQLKTTKYCPCCQKDKLSSPLKFDLKKSQKLLNTMFGKNEYKIVGKYLNTKVETNIKHKCGKVYQTTLQCLFKQWNLCPVCCANKARTRIIVIKGESFEIQGYENKTLDWLLAKGYKPYEIFDSFKTKKLVRFNYTFKSKECKYIPDFYIPSANLVIETKSYATLGLLDEQVMYFFGKNLLARNQAKARAVLAKGFQFDLHLWRGSKLVRLPRNWINMNVDQLKEIFNEPQYRKPYFRLTLLGGS